MSNDKSSPKVPGTVEDSHANVRDTLIALAWTLEKDGDKGRAQELRTEAARVEQLWRDRKHAEAWKALYDSMYLDKCDLQRERAAREAEIAKVRHNIEWLIDNGGSNEAIRREAARLGGNENKPTTENK